MIAYKPKIPYHSCHVEINFFVMCIWDQIQDLLLLLGMSPSQCKLFDYEIKTLDLQKSFILIPSTYPSLECNLSIQEFL